MDPSLKTLVRHRAHAISAATADLFPLKLGHLVEAVAFAYGFGSHAAFLASKPPIHEAKFDQARFVAKLATLTNYLTAAAVGAVLDGYALKVKVAKRKVQFVSHLEYDVAVDLSGAGLANQPHVNFILPEHGKAVPEAFRVDSAASHRSLDEPVIRSKRDERLLSARLIEGHWEGGMYVYAAEHQQDDRNCIGWVKASLARAVLSALAPVRCDVFRPSSYDEGCWRVRLAVSPAVREFWSGDSAAFDVPALTHHRFQPEQGYWSDIKANGTWVGRLVEGVWLADLYPNGQAGLANLLTATQVQSALFESMYALLEKQGFYRERMLASEGRGAAAVAIAGDTHP
ncbi:Uncharacterised protein [Bordetella ansorpii]|uniref:Uncharacterized protein n=1 Tax=Bordetella ansorpii TaxID=288768 RepID=A0A157QM01_9BORD|nr:hypothetical protein [Bordetella ansorpii]SAI46933.1 Uncharacterised protein [Bordetella ansorpii]